MPTLTGDSVRLLLEQVAIDVESNKDFLCDLDGEVGDGDHGVSMTIGPISPMSPYLGGAGWEGATGCRVEDHEDGCG